MSDEIVIIGGGLGGLAAAALLGKRGHDVTVLEKNDAVGGRASLLEESGYRFDMGPSWYLMPDFFEHFFDTIGEDIEEHLTLEQLSPSYRVFLKDTQYDPIDIHSDLQVDIATFDRIEQGAGSALRSYLKEAGKTYELSKDHFIYRNYDSIFDFFDPEIMRYGSQIPMLFQSAHARVKGYFDDPVTQKLVEYAFLFLGTDPRDAPAVYSVMNHVDYEYGVYYPEGGIYEVVRALRRLCEQFGVTIETNAAVADIVVDDGRCTGVMMKGGELVSADIVISNTDRHFCDTQLLPDTYQEFSDRYWQRRQLAPSAFLMYLGIDGSLPQLSHHNFVFAKDWQQHFDAIFSERTLPEDPSFYLCKPSEIDETVAPAGKEALYVLVPIAPGNTLTAAQKQLFQEKIIRTLASQIDVPQLTERILYRQLFTVEDFQNRYNSFAGSALGLSHTLLQSAYFRPNNVHEDIPNLYYVGADTNPGIGMPMVLASAELVYKRIAGIEHAQPMDPVRPL